MKVCIIFLMIFVAGTTQAFARQVYSPEEIEQAILEFVSSEDARSIQAIQKYINEQSLAYNPNYLSSTRDTLRSYLQTIGVDGEDARLVFRFSGQAGVKLLLVSIEDGKITALDLKNAEKGISLTVQNLETVFDSLEAEGFSGLVYIKKAGEELLLKPFGEANKTLGIPNMPETIFATGSRPIDYTIAAIMLLNQRGELELDDPITRFFENVPADKSAITIRHLLNGQSGLPDFFDIESDWNPDLAWIDRQQAEERLLHLELEFTPGTNEQHSHAAFGLLAAIVERVSGQEYYAFLRQHFFDKAGMHHTGEYGETRGFNFKDFAEGGGPERVGTPNIPPNWGPTSWLVKGSGGMYSTLGDLQKFYALMRSGRVLDEAHNRYFWSESVNLDGSMRGFELFSIASPKQNTEVYLFLNNIPDREGVRKVFMALEEFSMH